MNIDRAITGNRRYAENGLWTDRFAQILDFLALDRTCGERTFALAVGSFQEGRPPLRPDGILGPRTWERLDPETRFSTVPVLPPPWLLECRAATPLEPARSSAEAEPAPLVAPVASGAAAVPDENWRAGHLANAAPAGISRAMWRAAIESRDRCIARGAICDQVRKRVKVELKKRHIMTLVDFTKISTSKRLWVVVINKGACDVKYHLHVSHGRGSAPADPPGHKGRYADGIPVRMSNAKGSNASCVGAFITRDSLYYPEHKRFPFSLQIVGLDHTNSNALRRGIVFHESKHVSSRRAGRSRGCFMTSKRVAWELVNFLKGGSFVYAWFGEGWAPKGS